MNFLRKNWLLLTILAFVSIIRVVGIFYGFPLLGVFSDEAPTTLATLKMIGQFSWRANFPWYYYPALLSYLYVPFFVAFLFLGRLIGLFPSLKALQEIAVLSPGYFLPLARLINVIFGVATVFLVYKIAFKLFNKKSIGLIAAWLLAVSFFHSWQSHFATTWVGQTIFVVLAAYWAVVMLQKGELTNKDYLIGGLAVGGAFGVNFIGALSYLFFIFVHFWRDESQSFVKRFIFNKKFWIFNLMFVICFGLIYFLNPHGVNNYLGRIADVTGNENPSSYYQIIGHDAHHVNYSIINRVFYYIKGFWDLEPVYFLLFVPAVILLFKRERRIFWFLFSFVAVYFLFLSPLTGVMRRYSLPILPFIIIIIAYFVDWVSSRWLNKSSTFLWGISSYGGSPAIRPRVHGREAGRKPRRKVLDKQYLRLIFILLVSGQTLYLSFLFDTKVIQDDTRLLAQKWIYKNIPANVVINSIKMPGLDIYENKEAISLIKKENPDLFSTKRKYLLNLSSELYPYPSYYVVVDKELEVDLTGQFEYVIIGDFDFNNLLAQRSELPGEAKKLKHFYPVDDFSRGHPNAQLDRNNINPWQLKDIDFGGPYIEIYKMVGQ